jgi:hypothetical protein
VNMYGFVWNNSINEVEILGLREYGLGVSGTAAAVGGSTGGVGFYASDNHDDRWYDRFGIYGYVGAVVGVEIGAAVVGSVYERGAFRGASAGVDVGGGPFGAALYKSTDGESEIFDDASEIVKDLTDTGNSGACNGASLSFGGGLPAAASVTSNRTGVITLGDVGRAIKTGFDSIWNIVF